jgi:hypothetical protein
MQARLDDRRLQVLVFVVLAVIIVYNVVHFSGRKPRKNAPLFQESGMAVDLTPASAPNWASGRYEVPADWGRNPFTGREMAKRVRSPLSAETEPGPAG